MTTPQDKTTCPLSPHRLPLAVAVTGHRDIAPEDEATLHDRIRERFNHLQAAYPTTPLLALSGLAEGADMVFAEAALQCNITLWAVLPALPETFAREFDRPVHPERDPAALRGRFEALREQCAEVIVAGHGYLADDPRRHTFVGAYLVRRCHVLFALWNGDPDENASATAHVVRLAREGVPNRYLDAPCRALDAPDAVVIHHLRTPRSGQRIDKAFTWTVVEPPDCAVPPCPREKTTPLDHLEAFNKAAGQLEGKNLQAIVTSRNDLKLKEKDLNKVEKRIYNAFALADALGIAWQRQSRYVLNAIYALSVLMLVLFAIHTNVMANIFLFVAYYIAYVVGFIVYKWAAKRRMHHRFVDYRGLAEGLRVQLFFHLSGVRRLAADLYLRKQRAELTWMRQTMRVLELGNSVQTLRELERGDSGLPITALEPCARSTDALPEEVMRCWIENQAAYFEQSEGRERQKLRWYQILLAIGFYGGVIVGALGLIVEWSQIYPHDSDQLHWGFMLTGLLPALAALAGSYAYRRGLAQHIQAYWKMGGMFRHAAQRVKKDNLIEKPFAFRELVEELGKEALAENGQWVLHHRDLPPDAPTK
mgnify:CR=1 FL=1